MRTIRNSFGRLAVLAAAFSIGANFTLPASSYPSNTLWLSVASVSNGWVNLILNGTTPGTNLWLEIPTNGLTTPGQLTVVIHNTQPYPGLVNV